MCEVMHHIGGLRHIKIQGSEIFGLTEERPKTIRDVASPYIRRGCNGHMEQSAHENLPTQMQCCVCRATPALAGRRTPGRRRRPPTR